MQFKHCTLEIDGPVGVLRLDHQEVMNAVSMDMLAGLTEALDTIDEKRDEARCVVLTGAGRAFCTGANLQGRNQPQKPGRSNAGATLETGFHPFLRRVRNLHCPLVSAVNGPAAGAGMSFALMGDMILCARSSYFLQAFRRIGLVPDCGSTWLLPRLVGKARSIELSLMGERLPAEKALEWGLINRVHDDVALMGEAMKLAHELANGPTVALSLIRQLYWKSPNNSFEDQLNLEFKSQRRRGRGGGFSPRASPRFSAAGQSSRANDRAKNSSDCVTSFHPGATGVAGIARPSGGASQETWSFDIVHPGGNIGAILRRSPKGYGAAPTRAAGLDAEARLMELAHAAGLPSPKVMHVLTPEDDLGTGFIMARVEGETIARKILRDERFAKARPMLARQLGKVASGIHGLPRAELPALREMSSTREIAEIGREYRSFGWPRPVFELALRWLGDHDPGPSREVTLVHGDFRHGNLIIGPAGLRAVLDWELAHLGDPREDLGWICVNSLALRRNRQAGRRLRFAR